MYFFKFVWVGSFFIVLLERNQQRNKFRYIDARRWTGILSSRNVFLQICHAFLLIFIFQLRFHLHQRRDFSITETLLDVSQKKSRKCHKENVNHYWLQNLKDSKEQCVQKHPALQLVFTYSHTYCSSHANQLTFLPNGLAKVTFSSSRPLKIKRKTGWFQNFLFNRIRLAWFTSSEFLRRHCAYKALQLIDAVC